MTGTVDLDLISTRIILADRTVTGRLEIRDGCVRAIHELDTPERDRPVRDRPVRGRVVDVGEAWVSPGLVDLHTHGAVGVGPDNVDAAGFDRLAAHHARHGVTAFVLSTMTAPESSLVRTLQVAREASRAGDAAGARFLGVHLEGPFLNPACCGAQPPESCRPAELDEAARLWAAGEGVIRSITIAPEMDPEFRVIRFFRERGVVVAIGHSAVDLETGRAAVDAGASVVTHLFNGMPAFHHRTPGLVGLALTDPRLHCELICDGVHLDGAAVRLALAAKGAAGCLLISDSIPATECGDDVGGGHTLGGPTLGGPTLGGPTLGGQAIEVRDGIARLPDGTLAGSTLTLDRAISIAARAAGLDFAVAARMASAVPAAVEPAAGTGRIEVEASADLTILDDRGVVGATFVRGRLAWAADDFLPAV